jgi:hypothetical protein
MAWIAGGRTSVGEALRAATPSAFDSFRTREGIAAVVEDEEFGLRLGPGDALAARMAARATRRAIAMAVLEAEGWTPEKASAALGLPEPRKAAAA